MQPLAFKQWRVAGFVLFALAVESAAYRTTTLVIHRNRPPVHRLEQLPVNASYPSGHTAASIAVYCGLALLITSRIAGRLPRIAIWAVAIAIPVFVALSRMYRGMHHPLDVLGGAAIGIATIAAIVLVCRAAGISTAIRDGREPEAGGLMAAKVAVIAHAGKTFGDGLPGLRRELARQGVDDPLWSEVPRAARRRRRSSARSRPGRT